MHRILSLLILSAFLPPVLAADDKRPPNIVIVFVDDLGCYGAKDWKTPYLDRMAQNGMKFTDFYVAQPVCSASRAALLTGCYPNRVGISGALGPGSKVGISDKEVTLAQLCKGKGYATGMVGKWHLGHHPQFLPTRHGFDEWLGLPYSNDMWPYHPEAKPGTYPPLPLFDGEKVVNPNVTAADQAKLTRQYTERAVDFIGRNKDKPFFLYVAHTMPHVPLFAGEKFKGISAGGVYGDVCEEIDWSVGQIIAALNRNGLEKNTLVIFTSDNGPWLSYGNHSGSAGSLREGKGTVWEGGVREPFIASWPGVIPAGTVCREPAMTIDLFPTIAKLIGADLPKQRIDGSDIGPFLRGTVEKPATTLSFPDPDTVFAKPGEFRTRRPGNGIYFFYYNQNDLQAVRFERWKLMLPQTYRTMAGQSPGKNGTPGKYRQVKLTKPELYDLVADPDETTDVAGKNPGVLRSMLGLAEAAREELGDARTNRPGSGRHEPGRIPTVPKKAEFESELVFPLHPQHNHAPGIVECPNGDLLVSWYRGSGERGADDVAVYGARRKKGEAKWSDAFLMVDTPGFPDCNTTMWIDAKGKLWLFWPVILANTWESCLTQFRVAAKYDGPGAPVWDWQGTLFLKPVDFVNEMKRGWADYAKAFGSELTKKVGEEYWEKRINDKLSSRLGWQPRCKPTVLRDGRILLPLYSDTYSAGLMAISDDGGKTWTASKPLAGYGSIQPSVLEKTNGTLVAYMRENGPLNKVRVSESKDRGLTWGPVGVTAIPNPGSGLDTVRLKNGHWLIVSNDSARGRNSLAVKISDDEGKTWKWTRHLEKHPTGSFHYPAVIQAWDGSIHCVYSYFVAGGKSMKHARFNEEWVRAGD
ncbi:MAG TPA: sulfatase-like hydrolase/transferase [Fimbriiglobus sp.]|jgi:arylsulfatase